MPTICLKVSQEIKELWVQQATGDGITLSEWLRRAADRQLPPVTAEAPDGEVESAFKEYLRETGASLPTERDLEVGQKVAEKLGFIDQPTERQMGVDAPDFGPLLASEESGTATKTGPRSGQPDSSGNTEEHGAEEPGAPDTDTAPSDDAGASESSASAPPPETEEEDTARSPQVVDPGSGSTPASPNEPAASVSDKLAEAREALGRPFKGPDFRPEKKKKR